MFLNDGYLPLPFNLRLRPQQLHVATTTTYPPYLVGLSHLSNSHLQLITPPQHQLSTPPHFRHHASQANSLQRKPVPRARSTDRRRLFLLRGPLLRQAPSIRRPQVHRSRRRQSIYTFIMTSMLTPPSARSNPTNAMRHNWKPSERKSSGAYNDTNNARTRPAVASAGRHDDHYLSHGFLEAVSTGAEGRWFSAVF